MAETPTIADVKSDYKIFQSFSDDYITERINDAIAKAQHNLIRCLPVEYFKRSLVNLE